MPWGKGDAEIRARRDLKIRAVNAICDVADAIPLSASRGNTVHGDGNYVNRRGARLGAALHHEFLSDIGLVIRTANARQILTTAKGCSSAPREARGSFHYNQPTFYEFLEKINDVDCLGSYMEIAWAWAVQIVNRNPHSFPAGDWAHTVVEKVNRAEQAKLFELRRLL